MSLKIFNVYDNGNKVVKDAFDMLTAKIHINNSKKQMKTLVITSCKPGEGKTSLAISLAISIANSSWNVLLVDADMRKSNSDKRLGKETEYGLSDYIEGKRDLDIICETNVPNLSYLGCGTECHNPVEALCSASFENLITQAYKNYDFVLFDTPALESVADAAIIASKVEATLLVIETGANSIVNIKRVKDELNKLNANIIGVVLNKVKKHEYKRYFGSYNYFNTKKRFKIFEKKKNSYKSNIPLDNHIVKNDINM